MRPRSSDRCNPIVHSCRVCIVGSPSFPFLFSKGSVVHSVYASESWSSYFIFTRKGAMSKAHFIPFSKAGIFMGYFWFFVDFHYFAPDLHYRMKIGISTTVTHVLTVEPSSPIVNGTTYSLASASTHYEALMLLFFCVSDLVGPPFLLYD